MRPPSNEVTRAKAIVAGTSALPELEEFKELVRQLKTQMEFGWARRLLAAGRKKFVEQQLVFLQVMVPKFALTGRDFGAAGSHANELWLVHQEAQCTYRDEELPPSRRFHQALQILDEIGLRHPANTNAKTLSLGGAIYERMWEHGGNLDHLYQALAFFLAAWERNRSDENSCHGGASAALIYDQLAFRLRGIAAASQAAHGTSGEETGHRHINAVRADGYGSHAQTLRHGVHAELERRLRHDGKLESDYRFAATMADIKLGLAMETRDFSEAARWYGIAVAALAGDPEGEWKLQSAFKKALAMARRHGYIPPEFGGDEKKWAEVAPAFDALAGDDAAAALACQRGKVGLALSGGGFRAAFYHLGVMARLAEMDALRGVDVISTVSGGSVVGMHYYLELQHLLESQPDTAITRDHYVAIVRRVQDEFLAGVQRNLRVRALADLAANLRMIGDKAYSRTHRIGELYEDEIYRRVNDRHREGTPRKMSDLLIHPPGAPVSGFRPKYHNWRRSTKVPVLLVNTTSLNTGHNWHFTASWMGEPPGLLTDGVDANERYRRLYYGQAPDQALREFRLGYAVAASSGVPGLFQPVSLYGLYPGRTVRLVDGGVHDNQGVAGLLNEGCTRILCSDASGQMVDEASPADNVIGVSLRANDVLQDRIREVEYQDLKARTDSHSLDGLFFIHLKKDLETEPIDWTGCQDPTVPPAQSSCTTPYGIDKDLQRLLAGVRTDLDSFSEVEAYALMLSGYLMTEHEFTQLQKRHEREGLPGFWGGYRVDAPREDWPFLPLENIMRSPATGSDARRQELEKQLRAASTLFFKIWQLSPALKLLAGLALAGLVGLLGYLLAIYGSTPVAPGLGKITWGGAFVAFLAFAIGVGTPVLQFLRRRTAMRNLAQKAAVALVGWAAANIHLWVFDKMFLRQGRLQRLLELPGK